MNVHVSSQILPGKIQKHILKKIVQCVVSSNITKQLWNNFQQIQAQTIFPLNESLNVRILSCYFLYAAAAVYIALVLLEHSHAQMCFLNIQQNQSNEHIQLVKLRFKLYFIVQSYIHND